MWPFRKKQAPIDQLCARSVQIVEGLVEIDVQGQTCPGYLLSINREVAKLKSGATARILSTYQPCGEDIKTWCKEKNYQLISLEERDGCWQATIFIDRNQTT